MRSICCIFLFLWSGCVGFSRQEPNDLFPSDSLSRQIAEATPVDTLRLVAAMDSLASDTPWQYLNTAQYGPDGRLYASDLSLGRLYVFDEEGALDHIITSETFAYPYLTGHRGDTLAVLNTGSGTVDWLVDDRVVHSVNLPANPITEALSIYTALTDKGLFFKHIPPNEPAYLARLDERTGAIEERLVLPGPWWRHRGLLRAWGDTLLSLSAYRPIAEVIDPAMHRDSLALVGFDSPVLAKSRQFVLGDIDEPPLMSPSAVPVGDLLFVLNLRPGWVRIDAYDRTGRLQHILVDEHPEPTDYTDIDLAARALPDGGYEFAVVRLKTLYYLLSLEYVPRLSVYRWGETAEG